MPDAFAKSIAGTPQNPLVLVAVDILGVVTATFHPLD